MAGGFGTGTAALAALTKEKQAKARIGRNDGIAEGSERGCRGRDCTLPGASIGQQSRVSDAERADLREVEIELLNARERADAHAMQRAVSARDLVETRKLDTRGEQHFDAAPRILVIGEYTGLD